MRRLTILEPDLDHRSGHPHAFASSLAEVARARGITYRIYGTTTLPADFADRHGIVRLFGAPSIPEAFRHLAGLPLYRLMVSRRQMAEDLCGRDGPAVGRDDLVLLPTARHWLMLAVADWLRTLPAERRPAVAATFHDAGPLFAPGSPRLTYEAAAIQVCATSLRDVLGPQRLALTATTPALVRCLAALLDMPIGLVPVANPTQRYACAAPAADRRDPEGRARIALLGLPRSDKGPRDHVYRVAAAIAAGVPNAALFVQMRATFDRARDVPPGSPLAAAEIHAGALSDADYAGALQRSAVIVVPYEPASYRARVSGIFVDAVAAGCVTVVPSDTWMSEMIAQGRAAGVTFDRLDPSAIAAAVETAAGGLANLSPLAMRLADPWRRSFGVGPYLTAIEQALIEIAGVPAIAAAPGEAPTRESRPAPGRWILLEPRLGKRRDERRRLADALRRLADERRMAMLAWGREDAGSDSASPVVGVFRVGSLPGWASDRIAAPLARFIQASDDMRVDLCGPAGPTAAPDDHILLPDAEPWTLLALSQWLRGMPAGARPRVAVTFQTAPAPSGDRAPSLPQSMVALGVRGLVDVLPAGRLMLTATTTPFATALAAATGSAFSVVPTPVAVDDLFDLVRADRRGASPSSPRIVVLGSGSGETGHTAIPALVAAVQRRMPQASIAVEDDEARDGHPSAAAPTARDPDARRNIIGAAAIVVAAASPPRGQSPLPPPLRDVAIAGCIAVASPDTAMAAEIIEGRVVGRVAGSSDPDAVADAVAQAAAALPELAPRAMALAHTWRPRIGVRAWIGAIERLAEGAARHLVADAPP